MKYLKNFNTLLEYKDTLILDIPNTSYIIENKEVKYLELPKVDSKYIMYKSSDGLYIIPYNTAAFGVLLISTNYNDFGLLSFNAPVTSIGYNAFRYCSSLTSITIPNSVTSIGEDAFYGCSSLTSVTIPNSVEKIESFVFNDCSSLKTITCEAVTPPTLYSYNNLSSVTAVYVPAESVDAYKSATNWSYYANKIKPIQ